MKTILNTSNKIILLLPLLLILVGSCKKDFLEKQEYGAVPTADAIKNVDDMEAALNGAYAGLRSPNLYGRTIPIFGDLAADNVYISSDNSNRYLDFFYYIMTVNNGNARDLWQTAYNVILNANNVINSSVTGDETSDQLRGEALALRALMYFELVKHFAKPYTVDPNSLGVPIITDYDPFLKPRRNTVSEVYAQIENDLTTGINLMTLNRSSGYFTRYAAIALLARMHQFKGEWTEALVAAEEVIFNSGYSLLQLGQVQGYWASNTPRTDRLETLFEVVNDQTGNAGIDALAYFYDQIGYGDALVAESFYELFSDNDVRKTLILIGSPVRGNVKVANKFPNSSQPDKDEVKIIRMSEVVLIAAEAAYHTGNEALARDYLNAVATERVVGFTGYTSSGSALLDDILLERRKELAFEGHRYWDHARYNLDIDRIDLTGEYGSAPLEIPADYFRRIFPIPQAELDANPNIRDQQNQGY